MEDVGFLSVVISVVVTAIFIIYLLLTTATVLIGESDCEKLNNVYECKMIFVPKEVENE